MRSQYNLIIIMYIFPSYKYLLQNANSPETVISLFICLLFDPLFNSGIGMPYAGRQNINNDRKDG